MALNVLPHHHWLYFLSDIPCTQWRVLSKACPRLGCLFDFAMANLPKVLNPHISLSKKKLVNKKNSQRIIFYAWFSGEWIFHWIICAVIIDCMFCSNRTCTEWQVWRVGSSCGTSVLNVYTQALSLETGTLKAFHCLLILLFLDYLLAYIWICS